MSKVYLVNVGANTSHKSSARSPIFPDDTFIFVSFPQNSTQGQSSYPSEARPYVRNGDFQKTHPDPDWANLTYGDVITNPRASALKQANPGDILLFWGLLWRNNNTRGTWNDFTGDHGWFLLGALTIEEILKGGQIPKAANSVNTKRARKNPHFHGGILRLGHRVFIGDKNYSALFRKAVDLQATRSSGLLFRNIRSANGKPLRLNGKIRWNSSLRSCRSIWDLDDPRQQARARIVRNAIFRKTNYDLLAGIK